MTKYGTKKNHGLSNTKIYRKWADMIQRCNNEKSTNYEFYGAKGVRVCQGWEDDFMNFYIWSMDNGYKEGLSIDRKNPEGNYEPSNCRWSTREEQDNNKRNSVKTIINGEELTLAQVAKKYGFKLVCIQHRYNVGDRGEKLITPLKRGVRRDGLPNTKFKVKLSDIEVSEVRWLTLNTKLTQSEIGIRYNITQSMVSSIKRGSSHSDLKEIKPIWYDAYD